MSTLTRRRMLSLSGLGLGQLAVADLVSRQSSAAGRIPVFDDLRVRQTHFPPPAKAVIQLLQSGGPSQMDLFDPKPALTRLAGQPHPDGVEIHQPDNENKILASPFRFRKYGECGMDVSDVLPHVSTIVDDLCFVRSMHTEHNNHPEGLSMLLTCNIFPGRPTMGSWISYALGTENQNLPAYVVLRDPNGYVGGGKSLWANAWLPSLYQGVEFSTSGAPVHYLNPSRPAPRSAQRANLDFLQSLNAAYRQDHPGESELDTRIENFELAARMQLAAPSVLDLSKETQATRRLYGLDKTNVGAGGSRYGKRCLMARRLVESGVRFVQVTITPGEGWDHHSSLIPGMSKLSYETDQAATALVKDLKSRGLLDSTIVMWAGEFGRLPTSQNAKGRDHNRNAFTLWFAGGGFKPGLIYGETDEFGYRSIVNRVSVPDMMATVCHQMGLDHRQVQYPYDGRVETPADVSVTGAQVVPELISGPIRAS